MHGKSLKILSENGALFSENGALFSEKGALVSQKGTLLSSLWYLVSRLRLYVCLIERLSWILRLCMGRLRVGGGLYQSFF